MCMFNTTKKDGCSDYSEAGESYFTQKKFQGVQVINTLSLNLILHLKFSSACPVLDSTLLLGETHLLSN